MLPSVWCAAHALAHEIDSGHHEIDFAALSASAGNRTTSCDHDHAHSHPEAPPVLSTEGAKKLDASVLLTATVEIEGSKATPQTHEGTSLGYAARRAAAASRPRAPPIS